jgi:hypothetical protein
MGALEFKRALDMEVGVMEERIGFLKDIGARACDTPALEPKVIVQSRYFHDPNDLEVLQFNLEQEFPFLFNFSTLSLEDAEKLYGIFQWLVAQLVKTQIDSSSASLIQVITVAAALDLGDGQLWRELKSAGPLRSDRLDQLMQLIMAYKITITRHHRHMEHIDTVFLSGCMLHNWEGVDQSLRYVTDYLYDPLLSCAVRMLSVFSESSLEIILSELQDVVVLIAVIEVLNPLQAAKTLQVAVNSNSWPLKFCALRLSLNWITSGVNDEFQVLWEQLLRQSAGNSQEWIKWVAVFNSYPSRYPELQCAMGEALLSMSEAAITQYFNAIRLSIASSRKDLIFAFEKVQKCSDEVQRNLIWTLAHKRWSAWDFDSDDADKHVFSMQTSALDFAVAMYYLNCLSDDDRGCVESRLRSEFHNVRNSWYESITDYISAYNRHISRYQPFGHAKHNLHEGHEWLEGRHWYNPDWISKHLYWEIRNRL